MQLFDTHCHIHDAQEELTGDDSVRAQWLRANKPDPDVMIQTAAEQGVTRLICVGTTVEDSRLAVDFVQSRPACWASVGIHPHEAKDHANSAQKLQKFCNLLSKPKVLAVGECGLDYFYKHSPKKDQQAIFRFQLEQAQKHGLPLIFHVREAFDDFWRIFDEFRKKGHLQGVVHSFSAGRKELDQILSRNLYVGLNGIMTFTKNHEQLEAAKALPLEKMLFETDAPFLTPVPFRGKICEPKYVRVTAEFLANLRGESLKQIAEATTRNARRLFRIN